MGGFNRDIGVGIAIALDGKFMQELRQPLNRRRVIKLAVLCLLQFSTKNPPLGFRASRRLIQAML
jgi:hypothetical protein